MNGNKTAKSAAVILTSSLLMAVALAVFTIPNNLIPGGMSSVATTVGYLLKCRVSLVYFVLCVMVAALGIWQLSVKPILKAACIGLGSSVWLALFEGRLPVYTGNTLVAAVAGARAWAWPLA